MPFVPCPSCRRHVRAGDAACPFCSEALPASLQAVPAATQRLGRGALFAFAVSVAACGGTTETETKDAGADEIGSMDAMYGGPPDTGFVKDTGGPVAAYGSPPDTGMADTGVVDTGVTDDGGPAPAYGLPPSDGG